MTIQTAPDLLNGYVINGYDESNRWQTGVECVLRRRAEGGGEQTAYLSHECRAEAVGSRIFFGGLYEFVVVAGWNKTLFLRHGASLYSLNPFKNARPRQRYCVEESRVAPRILCQEVPIQPLSLDETLLYLRRETPGKGNRLFMRLSWRQDGIDYDLFAPCRYTNYPRPGSDSRYIQPISGYVLFGEKDDLFTAYAACHVDSNENTAIEFFIRTPVSYLALKAHGGFFGRLAARLANTALGRMLMTDEFARIEMISGGSCQFFVYAQDSGGVGGL